MLKPRTTVLNKRALLYKRYTNIEQSEKQPIDDIQANLSNQLSLGAATKYQINKYYFSGSFDYMIRGTEETTDRQYIKGLIIPATSLQIRTFDDTINMEHDDLVVIDGFLYSIESIEKKHQRRPKKFSIYYATLNSIL